MSVSPEARVIVRKLANIKKFGGVYLNINDVIRFYPKRMRDWTLVKKWIKELQKEDIIIIHKRGKCISLNKHKFDKIDELL